MTIGPPAALPGSDTTDGAANASCRAPRSARAMIVWTKSMAKGPSAALSANGSLLGARRRSACAAVRRNGSRLTSQLQTAISASAISATMGRAVQSGGSTTSSASPPRIAAAAPPSTSPGPANGR